jgi:uncharacterized caspase-like protein
MTMQVVRADVLAATGQAQRTWEETCLTENVVLVPGESAAAAAAAAAAAVEVGAAAGVAVGRGDSLSLAYA